MKSFAPKRWFFIALVLLAMFLVYTVIFSTGMLLVPTLQQEQWLLHRPLTGVDCVFFEWKNLGYVQFSLFFTLMLGSICLYLGYRRRVLGYLVLILLLGVGVEIIAKDLFEQPLSQNLHSAMTVLTCPQVRDHQRPLQQRLLLSAGAWWVAPPAPPDEASWLKDVAAMPLTLENTSGENSYPSGHATRWCFIGLVLCWLIWRHMKYRILKAVLMVLALVVAFGGGFMQFYIGVHLVTDITAGYLLGASSACGAIGLLLLNEKRRRDVSFFDSR